MLYISDMASIIHYQQKVLRLLSGKMEDFYLAGGTALSLYYFNHRESVDLDFFTREFNKSRIEAIKESISSGIKKKIELKAQELRKDRARMLVYALLINGNGRVLKIDFVEDYAKLIKPLKSINGINVLSLEDIYLRKLYAITGTSITEDAVGRETSKGGRQEAKDFYDLFCLSQIFMELSDFAFKFGNPLTRESIVRWFRTYSRLEMKTGLSELVSKKNIDYREMERHFKREIDKIIEKEVK